MTVIYTAAEQFYQALLDGSTKRTYGSDDIEVDMYEGKITDLWGSVGYSRSYYTKVRAYLIDTGCLSIIQQGSRGGPTKVVLHHPPDRSEFEISTDGNLTGALDRAILSQKVQDIEKQVFPGGIPLVNILADIEKRLSRTEADCSTLNGEVGKLAQTTGQEPPRPRRRSAGG